MQKTITIKNIVYSHTETPLLKGVSFKCVEGERLCILGENGSGKSTLLKIIAGDITEYEGNIDKSMHMRISYVPQEFESSEFETVVSDYMIKKAGVTVAKKVSDIAKTLGLDLNKIMDRTCGSLSGGQQKLLALSVVIATNPDFILLDEPENHIDIVSRMVLIQMLQDYRGSIIFISHDRLIIDALATKVAEIAGGVMHLSEGGYDDYIESKMERIGGMQRQYDSETKRIRQLEATVVILHQKALRGKEISAYKRKLEELNDLKGKHKESSRPDDKKTKIKIHQKEEGLHGGKLLAKMKDGAFHYEGAKKTNGGDIFRDADLEIRSGGHIVLLGRNGSGKSTFLKCLIKEWEVTKGEVIWTPGVKFSYFDQHANFDESMTPVEAVVDKLHCPDEDARAVLGSMRFNTEKMAVPIRSLSGGERMRLRFGIVFGGKSDVIIFDEPTNHLDEVTWEILLMACKNSKSTILLVSHDYEFIESFCPSVFWVIHKQMLAVRHKDLGDLLEELKD